MGGLKQVGCRKQERGSVRCLEVRAHLKREESASTRLLDGHLDMLLFFFGYGVLFLYLISNPLGQISPKHQFESCC